MSQPQYSDEKLAEMTELKAVVHDPRYEIVPIVGGGEFLYDPQVFWNWAGDGAHSVWGQQRDSILISDIGGQPQRESDWAMGHGAILRLNADNSWETIMAHGVGRQAGVFRPIVAPDGWGAWGGHIFFLSQVVPHRKGAINDHLIYRIGPGETKPDAFATLPRSGSLNDGITGAGLTGVFGRPGTAEAGKFLVFSMANCTIYAVDPDGMVEPYIQVPGMPYRVYYADPDIVGEENVLVVETQTGAGGFADNESKEALSHSWHPVHYRIVGREVIPQNIEALKGGPGHRAPAGFGPFAGGYFRPENNGFVVTVHWVESDQDGVSAFPYTTTIMRRDENGEEHVFLSNVQAGQNLIGFAGDRMIVTNMGQSYSTGNFKHPDGVVFGVRYKGE
jgi:hypothetical protein